MGSASDPDYEPSHRSKRSRLSEQVKQPGFSADDPISILSDEENEMGTPAASSKEDDNTSQDQESNLLFDIPLGGLTWRAFRATWGKNIFGFSFDDSPTLTITFDISEISFLPADNSHSPLIMDAQSRLKPFLHIALNFIMEPYFIAFRPSMLVPGLARSEPSSTNQDERYIVVFLEKQDQIHAQRLETCLLRLYPKLEMVMHNVRPEELYRYDQIYERVKRGKTRAATQKVLAAELPTHAEKKASSDQRLVLLEYPIGTGSSQIALVKQDLEVLDPGNFLNDSIVDFYLLYLQDKHPNSRFHIFNSFFYKRYTSASTGPRSGAVDSYEAVRKWTRNVDLFDKDFLIMPVCDKLHWSCVVVCHPGLINQERDEEASIYPCLLLFDSLGSHSGPKLFRMFRNYLSSEWTTRKSLPMRIAAENMPGIIVQVPQQTNDCDCGLFMLQYIEEFLQHPFSDLRKPQVHHPTWFQSDIIVGKRTALRQILLDLKGVWQQSRNNSSTEAFETETEPIVMESKSTIGETEVCEEIFDLPTINDCGDASVSEFRCT